MKKFLLSMAAVAAAFSMSAQAPMFDPADLDADGWLWFDTQAKVDKYIGYEGTPIMLVPTTFEPFDEPYASATLKGFGADGNLGTDGCKTGSLVLCAANGIMKQTGAGFMMHLAACTDMAVCISSDSKMYPALKAGKGHVETIDCGLVRSFTVFKPLSKAGIFTWNGMAELTHASSGLTIKSDSPVTVYFQNANSHDLYVHGIKVLPNIASAGVEGVVSDANQITFAGNVAYASMESAFEVYNLAGNLCASAKATEISLDNLATGAYIVRASNASGVAVKKVVVK